MYLVLRVFFVYYLNIELFFSQKLRLNKNYTLIRCVKIDRCVNIISKQFRYVNYLVFLVNPLT